MRAVFPLSLSLLLLACGGGGGDSYNPSTGQVETRPPWAFDPQSHICSFDTREARDRVIEAGHSCDISLIGNLINDDPWPGCSWPSSPDVSVCRRSLTIPSNVYADSALSPQAATPQEPDAGPDDEETE